MKIFIFSKHKRTKIVYIKKARGGPL